MSRPRSSRRILIADDNEDAAAVAAELLQLRGFEVATVGDGDDAIVAAHTFRPDMVVLDINMPRMNGYRAAMALRSNPPGGKQLLLIALTARAGAADVELARASGFDHHIAKPAADLAGLIAALFDAAPHFG